MFQPPTRTNLVHPMDCRCRRCAPPARPERIHPAVFGLLGFAVANAIAFAIEPAGAAHALLSCFGVG